MKIVFLHHANVCRGGIERMLAMKANWLVEHSNYEVVMLTYEQNGEPFPYSLSAKVQCVDLGVRLYSAYQLPYPQRYFKKKELRRKLSDSIKMFLDQYQPDIVTCTDKDTYEQNALIQACTQISKKPKLIIEAHTGMVDHQIQVDSTHFLIKKLFAKRDLMKLKQSVSRFDVLIALTPDDAQCWNPYIKTIVIPNSLSYFPEQSIDPDDNYKRVIAVGRLDFQKGHDLLLESWKTVERKHPDWELCIFGDGSESKYLKQIIINLGLKHAIIQASTENIYSEYMKSSFLACSSRWESFGLVIIEAMSCGLPVVSFDCDNGPRNIITNHIDGLLAKNSDIKDFADKICWMIEHKIERMKMGALAKKRVEQFKEGNSFPKYVNLYSELCK